ncbi:hypothetical protein [Sediminibacillus massiliensis]|uniref:hypothetical protein n=1 Tax=Sediminibacillus massiliensis TaxID=1926277 RepID=UPI00098873F8|nr:hypothetical protein [Sediminibacillus massiliensis]
MQSENFGIHEITDMRELINFKIACLEQAKTRLDLVDNPVLKGLVEQSVEQDNLSVSQMKDLLGKASLQMDQ